MAYACQVASVTSDSVILWTVAHQAPLSMGFSRQEHCSGLPCLPSGDLPNPGIEPWAPELQPDSLLLSLRGSPGGFICNSFPTVLEAGKSKMKVPIPDSMSHESPLADPLVFSLCRYMAKRQWGLIFLLCIMLGLCCCVWATLQLGCTSLSLRWLLSLWSTSSRCKGFTSCSFVALECRLSGCGTRP